MYNWLQVKQSGAINTIEAAKVVERMFNKFGTFSWIGIGRESWVECFWSLFILYQSEAYFGNSSTRISVREGGGDSELICICTKKVCACLHIGDLQPCRGGNVDTRRVRFHIFSSDWSDIYLLFRLEYG